MDEKKMIPLFDPNDRGGNGKSHLNPRVCIVKLGADIGMLSRILEKSMTEAVIIDEPLVVSEERRKQLREFWGHIAPYILEACVRGEGVMEEARIAMQLVTMRLNAVPGNPIIQILHEETP